MFHSFRECWLVASHTASGYNSPMPQALANFRVNVLFFGRVRELTGLSQESVELSAGTTLANLFDRYAQRFPSLAGFRASLVASRNQEFVSWDTLLSSGDDIAFLPPVSGG
jgi:molybdopterin converting factor subunit 1